MWESIKIFSKEVAKTIFIGIIFVFLDLADLSEWFIKSIWPKKWETIKMPDGWGFILFSLIVLWSSFNAYHKLRQKKMDEFLEYAPEFKQDRVFRKFYEIYRNGELCRDANTERRQKWDEEVLQAITTYCKPMFRINYLVNTRRDINNVTPLEDENYEKALCEVKEFLDNMFKWYIK